ncbi:MAG TPA: hypothetical protein VJU77_14870 [Chthoniobacterales bacterium]|nr:hypothetical protein [Chthoniobacterales bacterium]
MFGPMHGRLKKFLVAFVAIAFIAIQPVRAGSVGDFFKALGNSIAHPGQKKKTPPPKPGTTTTTKKPRTKGEQQAADYPPVPPTPPAPAPTSTPTATTSQPPVRPASAPTIKTRRDIPYAIPVPNKPGFVTSPYAPKQGLVDVRGFPSGTEVKDPYSGKTFLTP